MSSAKKDSDYRRRHPARVRAATRRWNIKNRYGLTVEEYEKLINTVCESCGSKDTLNLDHDHVSGQVRGVLCFKCNAALGLVRENVEILRSLANYVEKHRG